MGVSSWQKGIEIDRDQVNKEIQWAGRSWNKVNVISPSLSQKALS